MPAYDRVKAQQLINAARAQPRLPSSDLFLALAEQLELADREMLGTSEKVHQAQQESVTYKNQFEAEREDYKKFREEMTGVQKCVDCLREISQNGKGAKPKAEKALKEAGLLQSENGQTSKTEDKKE